MKEHDISEIKEMNLSIAPISISLARSLARKLECIHHERLIEGDKSTLVKQNISFLSYNPDPLNPHILQ